MTALIATAAVVLLVLSQAATALAGTPPIAAYSFDEGVGTTAHDLSGTHNGELKGSSKWVTGKFGSGLEFSPSTKDQVTIPSSEDLRLQNFTLEAWASSKESRKWAPLIAHFNSTDYGYGLYLGGELSGDPWGVLSNQHWSEVAVYNDPGPSLNTWTHLAVTNDGTNMRLYVNGTLVDTETSTKDKSGTGPLEIGGSKVFESGEYFAGKIDEVRVYNRALSAEEIVSDMNTPVEPYSAEINVLPTVDAMNRTESTFSNGGKWSALYWDNSGSGHNTGKDTTEGWAPSDGSPTINGAYWNPAAFADKPGSAAEATVQTPGGTGSPVAIWLDMPTPSTAKTGYQLSWTKNTSPSTTYTVKLSKWSAGSETSLASNTSVSVPSGTTFAISDVGGIVSAWQGTSGSVTSPILSVNDSTFSSGYAGIEGVGNATRTKNFKAGPLPGSGVGEASVLDNLERNEFPLTNSKWTKTNWAGEIGGVWCCSPYRGFGSSGASTASTYWNGKSFSDTGGGAPYVSATVGSEPSKKEHYVALLLDMATPGGARSGYEARFENLTGTSTAYKADIAKWVSGTRTSLSKKESLTLPIGTKIALTESAGSLVLWTGLPGQSSVAPLISAIDSTYGSGYTGLEVNGGQGTEYNFKAGTISGPPPLPDTTISSGSSAGLVPPNVAFSFTGTESPTSFECSMDGGAYSTCTSPKSYSALSEGTHTFKVRAVNANGADPSSAERSVEVLGAEKSVNKTALLDNLERDEHPLAKSGWSKDNWAASIGGVWVTSFKGFGVESGSTDAGAYWNSKSFSDSSGAVLVAGTVGRALTAEGERLALWLNAPSPGTAKTGYEARYERLAGGTYKAEIAKWAPAGTRTVLATKESFSLAVGETMALSETGGNLTFWSGKTGSGFTQVATANDSTYSSGYAGLEAKGTGGTIYGFHAGQIDLTPPDTFITSGPSGKVAPGPDVFYFGSTDAVPIFECSLDGAAFTSCGMPKEYTGLAEGSHTFKVRAYDQSGNIDPTPAERSFQINTPPETTITSAKPSYTSNEPEQATFTSSKSGSTFKCAIDTGAFSACTSPHALSGHLSSGWHTFKVEATDSEGVTDATPAEWTFNEAIYPPAPTSSTLVYPEAGKKTADYFTLKAEWGSPPEGGGVTGVSFQMKLPKWEAFETVPATCVIDGQGKPVTWPLAASSNPGHTEPVFLKVRGCAPFESESYPEKEIQFRAVFDGGKKAAGASEPSATEFIQHYNGVGSPTDATEAIGPAELDLLTGAFTINRTDVSIPVPGSEANLEFSRTYNSDINNSIPGYSIALGGWWQPSIPVEAEYEGSAWSKLEEQVIPYEPPVYGRECWNAEEEEVTCPPGEECPPASCEKWLEEEAQPEERWMELFDNEESGIPFEISGENFISPDYAKELVLTHEKGTENLVLSDPDGTHTIFEKNEWRGYLPKAVSFQATPTSARMVYVNEGIYVGLQLKRIIAPSQLGVTCGDFTSIEEAGCRTLKPEYESFNKWSEGAVWPSWAQEIEGIRYYNASGNPATSQRVAEYKYNGNNQLIEEWDPRLSSPELLNMRESYTYHSAPENNLLATLKPPGQEPWEFQYKFGSFKEISKLTSVSRASLLSSPSKATTTIAYGVPLSGSGSPYDMSPGTVATWGQSDFPVDATAVFPPTQVPSSPPTDYSQATVHYLDPDGYEVNTASAAPPGVSGASIWTTETDTRGNVVRSLTPQNRLAALAAGSGSVARSHELDSHSVYSADGTEMIESWGPLHKVRLESGEPVEARQHMTVGYDEGFVPTEAETAAGTPAPHQPTKETVAAAITGKADADAQVTETKYNWELRKPTEHIVDPAGLDLVTKTAYNSAGQVTEERQPSDSEGKGAGTTKTEYYIAGFEGQHDANPCHKHAAWAGLPCVSHPVAEPSPAGTRPKLPWTSYTKYSSLDEPEEISEKTNEVVKRTTTLTYDAAGRQVTAHVTGEGNEVPKIETTYNLNTGAPESQHFVCETSCTGFDTQLVTTVDDELGRPHFYEDADGNKSYVYYDLMGRPYYITDGKGSQTFSYDEDSGVATQLTDSAAGSFKATYNADGKMIGQLLPDGLEQSVEYDSRGTAVGLKYVKTNYCSSGCTWLEFHREDSIGGKVLKETSNLGTYEYSYDKDGRLTLTKETPTEKGCTTRAYTFDKDSDRLSKTTRNPLEKGGCDTESAGAKTSYEYDTADRLINTGVVYDNLGRITSLPSTYAGGGTLTTSYYIDDLTRSQTQEGLTNTYYLDAALRQRESVQSGTKSGTEVFHYAGGSDSPAWTQEGANWSREISGLGGGLGGIQKSSGETTLQLADMHGDVIATAALSPTETKLLGTQRFDEFGDPLESGPLKGGSLEYGWLGSKRRRTQLPSGVVQMGLRSYVPSLGRFLTPDPVKGGSANAYDYANQEPIDEFDLSGECHPARNPHCSGPPSPREEHHAHSHSGHGHSSKHTGSPKFHAPKNINPPAHGSCGYHGEPTHAQSGNCPHHQPVGPHSNCSGDGEDCKPDPGEAKEDEEIEGGAAEGEAAFHVHHPGDERFRLGIAVRA